MRKAYHASPQQGLTSIEPHKSTHQRIWVYATRQAATAALFLSSYGGDFTCSIGRDPESRTPYVCERVSAALTRRYHGQSGSVYVLDRGPFLEGKTPWDEELVCPTKVPVLDEIKVRDALAHLQELERRGHLLIVRYPHRIAGIPRDDSDLVSRAISWTREHGEGVLESVEAFHPHLLDRVLRGLSEEKS